jgi:outer membrane protein TolC
MIKKVVLLLVIIVRVSGIYSQINLEACLDSALANHPRSYDLELLRKISSNKIENYSSAWYPNLDLKAQATYQSDVIDFDLDAPVPGLTFPAVSKDQYKVYLDLRQTIYEGGKIRESKLIEELKLESSLTETEKEIEDIRKNIVEVYYNILKLQENIAILNLMRSQLEENLDILNAANEQGVALKSDLKLIEVEIMNTNQDIKNLEKRRRTLMEILGSLTGIDIDIQTSLQNTSFEDFQMSVERKEIKMLEQKKEVLKKTTDLLDASRKPLAYAFGQAGYGRPGLNMISDEFDSYYLVGIGLQWNIYDWGKTRREKNIISYQMDLMENKKEDLNEMITRARTNQMSQIEEHKGNIETYGDMLQLREDISETYRRQLKKGTIKTIDYLKVLNEEKIMRLKLKSEKIALQQAMANYMLISGDLKFNK